MAEALKVDHERGTATVPLDNGPSILVISEGKAHLFQLHDYGKFVAKIHNGKVTYFENAETGMF